ncbi:unnamed protein product [Ixodes persulcatus]
MQLVDVQKEIETQQMNIVSFVLLIYASPSRVKKKKKRLLKQWEAFLRRIRFQGDNATRCKGTSELDRNDDNNPWRRGTRGTKETKEICVWVGIEPRLPGFCSAGLRSTCSELVFFFFFLIKKKTVFFIFFVNAALCLVRIGNLYGCLNSVDSADPLSHGENESRQWMPELKRLPFYRQLQACCPNWCPMSASTCSLRVNTALASLKPHGLSARAETWRRPARSSQVLSSAPDEQNRIFVSRFERASSRFPTTVFYTPFHLKCQRSRGYKSELRACSVPSKHARSCSASIVRGNMFLQVASASLSHFIRMVLLSRSRCGWFPIAYTEPHDFGDISDFESFISGSDSSPAVPSSSSESSGGSTGVSHRWRPQSFGASQDVAFRVGLPSAPAPRRPLSSFADTYLFRQPPSPFHLRLDTGGPAESAAQPHHRELQPRPSSATLQPATALYGPANPTTAASATEPAGRFGAGGPAATTVAAGTPTSTDHHLRPAGSSSAASTPASGAAPATIHPLHHHLPGGVALRPPRRSMTSPFPFPMLPPRLPPSTSLHSSSDSGFCNDSSGQGSSTGGGGGGDKVTPSCSSSAEEVEEEKAEGEVERSERSKEEEEEEEREKAEAAEEAEDIVEEELRAGFSRSGCRKKCYRIKKKETSMTYSARQDTAE